MQIKRTKKCASFWATRYKVNILTRNIKHMWPLQLMKILLECCIQAKSLSHASLVIINWLTAGQIEDWISFTPCIRALVYPQGVKGVQPPLNVFNCVFAQKYCTSSAPAWTLYPKFCIQENVMNCTRTLISHFASEFASFCFVPDPWLGPLLENSWSITCELPPL